MKIIWKFTVFFSLMVAYGIADFTITRGESGDRIKKGTNQQGCSEMNPTLMPTSNGSFDCVNNTILLNTLPGTEKIVEFNLNWSIAK